MENNGGDKKARQSPEPKITGHISTECLDRRVPDKAGGMIKY